MGLMPVRGNKPAASAGPVLVVSGEDRGGRWGGTGDARRARPVARAEREAVELGRSPVAPGADIDGKSYYVKLAIREVEDGGIRNKFYDHELTEISEEAGKQGTVHLEKATGHPPATSSLDFIKHHGWRKFNKAV